MISYNSDGENEIRTKTVACFTTDSYEHILCANISSIFNMRSKKFSLYCDVHIHKMEFLGEFGAPGIEAQLYLVFISSDGIECIFHENSLNFETEMSCH